MKKIFDCLLLLLLVLHSPAQPAGYYNGTSGKDGNDLKSVLHEIINGHIDFSYSQAKYIINYSDADPDNEDNVILFYTQRSQAATSYGTHPDSINREHVWAKSHGSFSGMRPMDGDAFNLRPADASVNLLRNNLDFDYCSATGTVISEAPGTYYTSNRFEPADAVKGQVARIIFYMDTRYEGTNGEMDLETIDEVNTAGTPRHGKLSTLLEWNRNFPPTEFERRRNERIFQSQQNRNPFIDHPEYADLIWNAGSLPEIEIDSLSMVPAYPGAGETSTIVAKITSGQALTSVKLFWGKNYDSETSYVDMTASGNVYTGEMDLSGYNQGEYLYFKIVATDGTNEGFQIGSYPIPSDIAPAQITTIQEIQGTGSSSPLQSQTVTTTGIVIGNFDNTFYIQASGETYCGLCIFGSNQRGCIGDSIVITGEVTEYNNLTELQNISYLYSYTANSEPDTVDLTVSQIGEEYEGMLVTIRDCQFTEGGTIVDDNDNTYSFSDETGSLAIFSRHDSRLVGYELPTGLVNITGIVSQYGNDYQILVRDTNDLSESVAAIPEITEVPIRVFPNPARGQITIEIDRSGNLPVDVHLYNITGRIVFRKHIRDGMVTNRIHLDNLNLPGGIYILKILSGDQEYHRKIVVE